MKLLSVSLGNRRGELEVFGNVDVSKKSVTFQLVANGLLICEGESYDELRDVVFEIVALNKSKKEGMN